MQFLTNGSGNYKETQAPLQEDSAALLARGHGHGKRVRVHIA